MDVVSLDIKKPAAWAANKSEEAVMVTEVQTEWTYQESRALDQFGEWRL